MLSLPLLIALLALAPLDPPATGGSTTPPDAPSQAPTAPAPTPPNPGAGTSDKGDQAIATESKQRRLWIVLDFYKEFGGTIVREDDANIVLRTPEGAERSVDRNSIVFMTQLLEDPAGTPVIARLRDGRTLKGELVRDDFDVAVVSISGVQTRILRANLWKLELEVPFDRRLAQLREKLQPGTPAQRIVIARWCMNEGRPDIAIDELRAVQRIEDSEEVQVLLKQALLKDELRRGSPTDRPGKRPTVKQKGSPKAATDADGESALAITDDDVNRIRVMEVNFARPPRMDAAHDLWKRIAQAYGTNEAVPAEGPARQAMAKWKASQLLQLLFTLKARDLYNEVRVNEDPEHLDLFRRKVHDAWLIPNCATSQCHGSGAAGLRLIETKGRSPRAAYTNLLTLLSAKTTDGHLLVDFDQPAQSPLLDMARPRDKATRPHPDVPGWKASLTDSRGDLPAAAEAWIRGMHRPKPDYGVKIPQPPPPVQAPENGGER